MTSHLPQTFEEKLARIDAIVKELEGGTVELQRATGLFKEGKVLARECEQLLKAAQEQIDEAAAEPKPSGVTPTGAEPRDELPF
ncbi:MAG: exodeoxyribonuclease VII small subunit [Candidatus Eremiobacteraeota bacterium]|nr:exodeoxyribonuclease VII small subunit [Candidatus Eremiobacteraeota bacterium]